MNTKTKFGMLIASVALAASGAVCAADAPANPYVQAAGQTLMTNFGLCVRTGYWTLLWQKPGRSWPELPVRHRHY